MRKLKRLGKKVLQKAEQVTGIDIDGDGEIGKPVKKESLSNPQNAYPAAYVQQKPLALPDGWEQRVDTGSGKTYYLDHNTKTTHWHLPSSYSSNPRSEAEFAPGDTLKVESVWNQVIQPSGKRKALIVGINYPGTKAELRGCVNDAIHMNEFLIQQGFPRDNIMILTDSSNSKKLPTKNNLLQGMRWLAQGAEPGDVLFFHFSGHGGQEIDRTGHEEDGYNETIIPCDFRSSGQIIDDILWDLMVKPLPSGVRLTAIMDCCHSGTGMDLPFTLQINGGRNKWVEDTNPAHSKGDVLLFSGCADDECSSDGDTRLFKIGGAMTNAFLRAWELQPMQTFAMFMNNLKKELKNRGFLQKAQLTSSQQFDVNEKIFSLVDGIERNKNPSIGRQFRKKIKAKRKIGHTIEELFGKADAIAVVAAGAYLLSTLLD